MSKIPNWLRFNRYDLLRGLAFAGVFAIADIDEWYCFVALAVSLAFVSVISYQEGIMDWLAIERENHGG